MKRKIKALSIPAIALGILIAALPAIKEWAVSKPPAPRGSASLPGGMQASVVRITDGDTIVCRVGGSVEKVRLIGVDTPETRVNEKFERDISRDRRHRPKEVLRLGREAKEFTKRAVPPGSAVRLETDAQERDRYGRLLAYVWLPDGKMLNALLVSEGQAKVMTVPPNVKYVDMFLGLQKKAREEGKGIWADGR